ncbi:GSCOCG00001317001-RA-CDS [Cotesia congregata]|uniref:Enoyl-CoA hydratase domain-containing protein 3, mitochondrial n=1 Tax=Cotesia congregata TaxID=51543 RepID=A0A8J2MM58_COTCN|nr:GSCOCG00001317001-RA-CDS [Cotesia congregata]CAG5097227.1 Similar to Echdc3: Enoyl-CoA hydratase domain-containing protein 3 [Cotesia congregata]
MSRTCNLLTGRNYLSIFKAGKLFARSYVTNTTFESEKYIESDDSNGVRTITLSHDASRNSLSLEMMKILTWNLERDDDKESLRAIVIAAAPGKVFSAGHNLKELTTAKGNKHHYEVFETAANLMKTITNSPVPVIAAVDGLAAAAGCQLVSSCDIVICTERSSFSTPGANFGIFCSTPGIPLVRNVPQKIASYMLYTGLPLTAQEALNAGLVSKVVPNDRLYEGVKETTDTIKSKSRAVVQLGKKFLFEQQELDLSSAYYYGTEIMLQNLELKDAQEGIKSFVEKRKPVWKNKFEKDEGLE